MQGTATARRRKGKGKVRAGKVRAGKCEGRKKKVTTSRRATVRKRKMDEYSKRRREQGQERTRDNTKRQHQWIMTVESSEGCRSRGLWKQGQGKSKGMQKKRGGTPK